MAKDKVPVLDEFQFDDSVSLSLVAFLGQDILAGINVPEPVAAGRDVVSEHYFSHLPVGIEISDNTQYQQNEDYYGNDDRNYQAA